MITRLSSLAIVISSFAFTTAAAEDWPQFRGPGGRGVSETARPPLVFGPGSNLVWKVAVPLGYSSPVVSGDRVFLTAESNGKSETFCLDRTTGRLLWTRSVNSGGGIRATPTPVTDGKMVYVSFPMSGLIAYDFEGNEKWRELWLKPDIERSASPILIDDKLIVLSDEDRGSFVEARDKKTGGSLWRVDRPDARLSRSTPFHWVHPKGDELIVAGSYWLTSYDPRTGKENWRYSGTSRSATTTPTSVENLLFSANADGAEGDNDNDERPAAAPSFSELIQAPRLPVTKPKPENALLAVRSCGRGDVTATHLAWKVTRSLPGSSSPLSYKGRLFTIKNGGFLTAYDVKSGKTIYQDERINAPGDYYASMVGAADRVYAVSEAGMVTVLDANAETPVVLAQNKLGEKVYGTPAIVGETILVRTETTLYSFGAGL